MYLVFFAVVACCSFFVSDVLAIEQCDAIFDECKVIEESSCMSESVDDQPLCFSEAENICLGKKTECEAALLSGAAGAGAGLGAVLDSGASVAPPITNATPKAKANNWGLDVTVDEAKKGQAVPNVGKSIPVLIGSFIKVVLSIVGTLFFLLMVYAGFLWMTARGETEKVQTAQRIMTSAIVGVLIISASYAIVRFVLTTFG